MRHATVEICAICGARISIWGSHSGNYRWASIDENGEFSSYFCHMNGLTLHTPTLDTIERITANLRVMIKDFA